MKHVTIGGTAPMKSGVDNITLFDENGNILPVRVKGNDRTPDEIRSDMQKQGQGKGHNFDGRHISF